MHCAMQRHIRKTPIDGNKRRWQSPLTGAGKRLNVKGGGRDECHGCYVFLDTSFERATCTSGICTDV